jgi:hypothetical protein
MRIAAVGTGIAGPGAAHGRFVRIWPYCRSFCEAAFRERSIRVLPRPGR